MTEPARGSADSALAMAGPLLLAVIATALGERILSERIPTAWYAAAIVALLLFLAVLTFKQTPGWNTGLLVAFAAVAGGFVGAFFPATASKAGAIVVVLLGLSALLSRGRWASRAVTRRLFWMLSWLYIAGWPVLLFAGAPMTFRLGWAAGGVVVFIGLATAWLAARSWQGSAGQAGTAAGIELYLIGLNLLLAGSAVLDWLP